MPTSSLGSLRRIALLSAVLSAALITTAWCAEPDWVFLDENADSSFYYDQSGSKKPHDVTVRVRTRVVYTEQGKAEALKILDAAKKFHGLSESRYLHELNCKKEQSRLLESSHLDKDGATLALTDLSKVTSWEDIPPEVRLSLVFEEVCNSTKK